MAQNHEVRFKQGDRVQVFHSKDRCWRPGTVKEVTKTGATVKLDVGYEGFFYWASMSPVLPQRPLAVAPKEAPKLPPLGDELLGMDPKAHAALGDVRIRIVMLTPELAGELLARNEKNRSIKATNLARVKNALQSGKWMFNGDTICLSANGCMFDGQHRCQGVLETGVTVPVILVEGLNEAAFDTKDIGARRNASDVLYILGETNCRSLAAALIWVARYYKGTMEEKSTTSTYSVEELLDEHRELSSSVRLIGNKSLLAPASLMAALHYMFSQDSREDADLFIKDLNLGAGLPEDDAVFVLRERLMKNRTAKAKLPPFEIAALMIKAWNARRLGTPVRSLSYRAHGESPERFPSIYGGVRQTG